MQVPANADVRRAPGGGEQLVAPDVRPRTKSPVHVAHGDRDELRVIGREIYLCLPDGYGRSKLSNAYFEKRLGVPATSRNWNTVTKLAELAGV